MLLVLVIKVSYQAWAACDSRGILVIGPGGGSTWKISLKKVSLIPTIGARLPEVDLEKDTRKSTLSFSSQNSFIQVYRMQANSIHIAKLMADKLFTTYLDETECILKHCPVLAESFSGLSVCLRINIKSTFFS